MKKTSLPWTHRSFAFIGLAILIFTAHCTPQSTPTPSPIAPTPTLPPTAVPVQLHDDGAPLTPTVISQHPALAEQAQLASPFEIIFDQPMDPVTTTAAWQVTDSNGQSVSGQVTWPTQHTLHFAPELPLKVGEVYQAVLSTNASSQAGVHLAEAQTFTFNTLSALNVVEVVPAADAREVDSHSVLTVIFNQPVVPLVTAAEQTALPDPLEITPTVSGQGEWINTSVYVFRPTTALVSNTAYRIKVVPELKSINGTRLTGGYEWRFTTRPATISWLYLFGTVSRPPDNYLGVPLDQGFSISFRQPMDHAGTEAAFKLVGPNGKPVKGKFEWKDNQLWGDQAVEAMTFKPARWLALDTRYTLTLSRSARATDGGRLKDSLLWHFTTQGPPAISRTSPAQDSTQETFDSRLVIDFASPMNPKTLKGKAQLSPEPEGLEWQYDQNRIMTWHLQPSVHYTLTLLPGMADLYGNVITQTHVITFTTAPETASAYLDEPGIGYRPLLYRASGDQDLYVRTANVATLKFSLYHLSPADFIRWETDRETFEPPTESLVRQWQKTIGAPLNTPTLQKIPLTDAAGRRLPPGMYFVTLDSPEVKHDGTYLQATPVAILTANLTLKTAPHVGFVWLTDLDTGAPVPNVSLKVYRTTAFNLLAEGQTDAAGLWRTSLPSMTDLYRDPLYVFTDSGQVFGLAETDWGGASAYDYVFYGDYPSESLVAYLYTDRPLYRPGQTVYFKGIVRQNDDLDYRLPQQREVYIAIRQFGEDVYHQTLSLSDLGTFAGEFKLADDLKLGPYSIDVLEYLTSQTALGSGSFNVAEYRKLEFQVEAQAETAHVLTGKKARVNVAASYFSGGPVANAEVKWKLTAHTYTFQPTDPLSGYRFADFSYYRQYLTYESNYYYRYETTVAEGQAYTDAAGQLTLALPVDLSRFRTDQEFTLEASVTDVSGNLVVGRATFVGHVGEYYVGIKPTRYISTTGQAQTFDLVAVDWNGQPLAGKNLAVQIVHQRWYSVQKETQWGTYWESHVEEKTVKTVSALTGKNGQATLTFTPEVGGIFVAKASSRDARGNAIKAAAYLWVSSPDAITWERTNDHKFELIADRDAYAPGDSAELLIASPFQGTAHALITIERGHILSQSVITVTGTSTIYKLPITAEMAPNAYVGVTVIKGVDDFSPQPDYKIGMVELKVDRHQRLLNVSVTPSTLQTGPGETLTYTVKVTDYAGRPVEAEVSLALADLAALSLAEPNSKPLIDFFYPLQLLQVRTTIPLILSVEPYNTELEDQVKGGGGGGGSIGVIEVRQDFPDTAYWKGQVLTDKNGLASVSVTLPDNLTTWRMDARAVTADTRVGQSTVDIVTTKPLLVRPQTPRFFIAGDQATLSTAVHNNTDSVLETTVTLQAEGVTLKNSATQTLTIPANSVGLVNWDTTVQDEVERVDLVFSAHSGTYADASRPTLGPLAGQGLPVYHYQVAETNGTAGQLTVGGSQTEGIRLPVDLEVLDGQLTIKLDPSLASGVVDGLNYLEDYPYACNEQTVSSFLPNVLTTTALKAAGLSNPELESHLKTQVNLALQKLYRRQHGDGGWGWWTEADSDLYISAYVVLGLVEAKDAGYEVNQAVLDRGVDYVQKNLKNLSQLDSWHLLNRQAFLLYTLARAGKPAVSDTVQLYDQEASLSLYARAHLAQTLYLIDPNDPRLETLKSDFNNAASFSATGVHWDESQDDVWNWNTDIRSTAIILDTLLDIDPHNPLNANAVRWLMSARTQGYWPSTQETVWSLRALTHWMTTTGELHPDYQYEVALNGSLLGKGTVTTESVKNENELHVALTDLLSNALNRLTIARNGGPGNLYYTTYLTTVLPVPQVRALDRGFTVKRAYYQLNDLKTPVTTVRQGDLFLAKITLVAPESRHYVLVEDYLPAGVEAVDQSLKSSPQWNGLNGSEWQNASVWGWGWWYFSHVELHDEKVAISARFLPAGVYEYTYLVRATRPGEYQVIPPTAQEFYLPEVYGRGDGMLFTVKP